MRPRRSAQVPFPPTVLPAVALTWLLGLLATPAPTLEARARQFVLGNHGSAGYCWFLGLWALALELHVVVHEAGHALAGLAAGYRLHSVELGLARLVLHPRLRVERQRDGRFLFGGLVRAVPGRAGSRARRLALVAGGPAASLLAGGALLAAAVLAAWPGGAGSLRTATGLAGVVGLLLGATALVPHELGRSGLRSDGALLLAILRERGPEAPLWVHRLLGGAALGVRPRESGVDPAAAAADALANPGERASNLILATALALDSAEPARAAPLVERGLALLDAGAAHPLDVLSQATQLYALVLPDRPRARALCDRLLAAEGGADYGRLAAACLAHAEGRAADAARERDAWLAWTETTANPAFARGGNEWALERLGYLER